MRYVLNPTRSQCVEKGPIKTGAKHTAARIAGEFRLEIDENIFMVLIFSLKTYVFSWKQSRERILPSHKEAEVSRQMGSVI